MSHEALSGHTCNLPSFIDYVLARPSLMPLLRQLRVTPAPESDHLAVHQVAEASCLVPCGTNPPLQLFMSLLFLEPAPHMYTHAFLLYAVGCFMSLF